MVGLALVVLWTFLLAAGQVPEVQEGRVDIWFRISAELVMAGLLLVVAATAGALAVLWKQEQGLQRRRPTSNPRRRGS